MADLEQKDLGDFVIKELDHTTAEELEASVDEVKEARGTDDLGVPFNTLAARLNYIEEKMNTLTPNVVAISSSNYAKLPASLKQKRVLYVIVESVTETMGISVSGTLSADDIAQIENYGGVFADGNLGTE